MNKAEGGKLAEADALIAAAVEGGASARNVKATKDYVDSFKPPDQKKKEAIAAAAHQANPVAPAPNAQTAVVQDFQSTHQQPATVPLAPSPVAAAAAIPIPAPAPAPAPVINPNVALCKTTFDMQVKMAMHQVAPEQVGDMAASFASMFAPRFMCSVNPKGPIIGPQLTGTFQEVMAAVGHIWLGFKNSSIVNVSFVPKNDKIVMIQRYDQYLIDSRHQQIPGTENNGFEVVHTCTYDSGKITGWVQEFDQSKLTQCRNVANIYLARNAFELQKQMGLGLNITSEMMAEFGKRLAGYFGPQMALAVNPGATPPGPQVIGSFDEVLGTLGSIWMGFKNTAIENVSFTTGVDEGSVVVVQRYDNHLTTSSGDEIPGTSNKALQVQHTLTCAQDKIMAWVQEFDDERLQGSRDAAENAVPEIVPKAGYISYHVTVQEDADSQRLGLSGLNLCEITPEKTLTLQLVGAVGETKVKKEHIWPLALLRRYGRSTGVFYFEAGKKCASGPAVLHLEVADDEQAGELWQAADKALDAAQGAKDASDKARQDALAKAAKEKREAEVTAAKAREEAVAKHAKGAATAAKIRQRAEDAKQAAFTKHEALNEAAREAELANQRADAPAARARQANLLKARKSSSNLLELNQGTSLKVGPRKGSTLFGIDAAPADPRAGKSKIWLALNPEPLAFQTAADRREQEEGKVELGYVGGRSYGFMSSVMNEGFFDDADLDGDGMLSLEEAMAKGMTEEMFNEIDGDGNGQLTLEEFTAWKKAKQHDDGEVINELADGSDDESDGDYEDSDYEEEDIPDLDDSVLEQLAAARVARAKEEEQRKSVLQAEFAAKTAVEHDAMAKELAIIEARQKIENDAKEKERDSLVEASMRRMASELKFDFTFFGAADADGDGMLSIEEAKAKGMDEATFHSIDEDNSGHLSQEEFLAWQQNH